MLVQAKVDLNGYLGGNRLSIFGRWLKLPFAYRFDGLFVDAMPKALQDSYQSRLAG